jgi:DNA transposition AAA+ family ATPase
MYDETRQALREFIAQSRKSQSRIAKETGLSATVISQFLNDVYTGDNRAVAKTIEQYLTVSKERLTIVSTARFNIDLYNTQEALFACNYAHRRNDVTLVSGDAGAGKTTALRHYAETTTGVIMVTANACITSATAILGLICEKLHCTIPGRRATLMKTVIKHLAGTNMLIIVDEADYLSFDALQAVRSLNDLAGVGVVFAGNDRIYRQMVSGRRSSEFDQLRTRIIVRKKVFNDYSPDEISGIFPDLNQEGVGYILSLACAESLRTAKKLFDVASEYAAAKGQALSIKHLRDTKKQLLGEVV